jgi:hypothetical protein
MGAFSTKGENMSSHYRNLLAICIALAGLLLAGLLLAGLFLGTGRAAAALPTGLPTGAASGAGGGASSPTGWSMPGPTSTGTLPWAASTSACSKATSAREGLRSPAPDPCWKQLETGTDNRRLRTESAKET